MNSMEEGVEASVTQTQQQIYNNNTTNNIFIHGVVLKRAVVHDDWLGELSIHDVTLGVL